MIFIFVLCVLLLAFVSAAETALTSLSEAKTRQILETKKRGVKALKLWLAHPNRVLTTLLVGNNIAGALSASIATVLAEEAFDSFVIGIGAGVTTLILLVFGEVTPKTFARHNAEVIAPIAITLLTPFYWLFYPLVFLLTWTSAVAVRAFGGRSSSEGPLATEEDITYMIRLGHKEGVLASAEGEMLESVIEFRDTLVKEAMVPRTRICWLEKSASLSEVKAKILEHGHSRWPVYEDHMDNVVGIFNAKDLLLSEQDWTQQIRSALFVPEMMKIGELLKEFQRGKAHLAVVVDEYGGTAGIISLEDVLEEIVGEIRDEYDDEEEALFTKLAENLYEANGHASIYDLGDALKLSFPEEQDYESLAGFLMATYGKMPPRGTYIDYQGWRFLIEKADEKKIERVKICLVSPES